MKSMTALFVILLAAQCAAGQSNVGRLAGALDSLGTDSCSIRKTISLPGSILGTPAGGPVRLLLSIDDYGYFWVNGESRGMFLWDGEFELTKDARSGQKFMIAIKAVNAGGPLRLIRAEIASTQSRDLRRKIKDLALSFRTGEKLLSFDTYQTNARTKRDPGVDRSRRRRL